MSVMYLDSSALAKLVVAEAESAALTTAVAGSDIVSSHLAFVECARAAQRRHLDTAKILDDLGFAFFVGIDELLLRTAAEIQPPMLRTLDAIHLATALRVGADLTAFVCYDARLAEAAALHELPVLTPQ